MATEILSFAAVAFVDLTNHSSASDLAELCRTKPPGGTPKCYRYLGAFALVRAKPLVVAVTPVRSDETTRDVVENTIDCVAVLPFNITGLLADRAFYNGASIQQFSATAPVV